MSNCWLIFSQTIDRANPRIQQSDIEKSIAWYEQQMGREPKLICLHQSIGGKLSIPDDIQVRFKGGCLASEIWLAGEEPRPLISISAVLQREENTQDVSIIDTSSWREGQPITETIWQSMTPDQRRNASRTKGIGPVDKAWESLSEDTKRFLVMRTTPIEEIKEILERRETIQKRKRGRPMKFGPGLSRTTLWRRSKKLAGQGALLNVE